MKQDVSPKHHHLHFLDHAFIILNKVVFDYIEDSDKAPNTEPEAKTAIQRLAFKSMKFEATSELIDTTSPTELDLEKYYTRSVLHQLAKYDAEKVKSRETKQIVSCTKIDCGVFILPFDMNQTFSTNHIVENYLVERKTINADDNTTKERKNCTKSLEGRKRNRDKT